jgi:predicted nucleotidyltransferase
MAELINNEQIKKPIAPVLSALLDDTLAAASSAGVSLKSAVLYGSAATRDYNPNRSDINVFLVFDKVSLELLKSLRGVFTKHFKQMKSNPVVLDAEYIAGSTDVFPMEFLEWKENSMVFYGEDPLEHIEISSENLRLSIEANLRGKRLRLIQSFFEFDPKKKQFQPFLLSTLPNFLVVSRNILRLLGVAVSSDRASMLDVLERKSGVELKAFKRLAVIKADNVKLGQDALETMFKQFLGEIDALIVFIDTFDTGKAGK